MSGAQKAKNAWDSYSRKRKAIKSGGVSKKQKVEAEYGSNTGAPTIKKRDKTGKNNVEHKKKKTVKVPKLLRKQIKKVVKATVHPARGTYGYNVSGVVLACPYSGSQFAMDSIAGGGYRTTAAIPSLLADGYVCDENLIESPYSFSPEYFVHAASVLFNGKADIHSPAGTSLYSTNTLQSLQTLTFNVKTAQTTYDIKNVSGRTITMDIYLCAPRKPGFYNWQFSYTVIGAKQYATPRSDNIGKFDYFNTSPSIPNPGTASVATSWDTGNSAADNEVTVATVPPLMSWFQCCASEFTDGKNLSNSSPFQLGLQPSQCSQWNKMWKWERTTVILEPAQSYCYKIAGPKDMMWKSTSHVKQKVFMNLQKYMRCPMIVLKTDLTRTDAALGVATRLNDVTKPVLAVERFDSCTLEVPEQAGFQYPAVTIIDVSNINTKNQNLTYRRPVYYYNSVSGTTVSGAIAGVAPDNVVEGQ